VVALAERFVLPSPIHTNDRIIGKIREYIGMIPKITGPLAEQPLKEIVNRRRVPGIHDTES
jgi:hypothetical protein